MPNPLPPGPELDAKIATEVMEWTEGKDFYTHDFSGDNRKAVALLKDGAYDGEWSPSTNVADLFDALERFPYFELTKNLDDDPDHRYCCELYGAYAVPVAEFGETAPLAACRAMLAAKELK